MRKHILTFLDGSIYNACYVLNNNTSYNYLDVQYAKDVLTERINNIKPLVDELEAKEIKLKDVCDDLDKEYNFIKETLDS